VLPSAGVKELKQIMKEAKTPAPADDFDMVVELGKICDVIYAVLDRCTTPEQVTRVPVISFHSAQWARAIASSAHFVDVHTLPLRNVPSKKRSHRLRRQRPWMPDPHAADRF
jgi:hypothetical protein